MKQPRVTLPSAYSWQRERDDLLDLALCALAVPLIWWLALGWIPSVSVAALDQMSSGLPLLLDLLRAGGDWSGLSYRIELVGGAKVHPVFGTPLLHEVFARAGLPPLASLNLASFFAQSSVGFFAIRTVADLSSNWSGRGRLSWSERAAILLLSAFAPVCAWQIGMGHAGLAVSALAGVSLLSLVLAARARTLTLTLILMTVLTQVQVLPSNIQMAIYAPWFAGAVILAAAHGELKFLLPALMVSLGSIALALPRLMPSVQHALSSDASRALSGAPVIYSYIEGSLVDWVSALPWSLELIPSGRDEPFWHEINFAFGPPLLLMLALFPWKRSAGLGFALIGSALLAVLFSIDFPGVASLLATVFPPIESFRVPQRSALFFALWLPAVASAVVVARDASAGPSKSARTRLRAGIPAASAFVAGVALTFLASEWRELLLWTWTITWLVLRYSRPGWKRLLSAPSLLIFLGLGSLGAFKERLQPFPDAATALADAKKLRQQILEQQPALASPLERVSLEFRVHQFNNSSAYAMGLSSLSGYFVPTRRFLGLYAALSGKEAVSTLNNFHFSNRDPGFSALVPLYNIGYSAELAPDASTVRVYSNGPTAGRAWFASQWKLARSWNELRDALRSAGQDLHQHVRARAWVIADDPAVRAAVLPADLAHECEKAKVVSAEALPSGPLIRVEVASPASCPLTIATNYAENLRVHAKLRDGSTLTLRTFPAYGALLATMVPAGATEISVVAEAALPVWRHLSWLAGVLLLAGTWWISSTCSKSRKHTSKARGSGRTKP